MLFTEQILGSLPAALITIDAGGRVLYAGGNLAVLGNGGDFVDITGSRLVDYVDSAEHALVEELVSAAASSPEGEVLGPVRVSYYDRGETLKITEVWAVNRSLDPEIGGVVLLLLPESVYDRFDQVLMSVVGGSSIERTFGALSQSLRFPPVVSEAFFLMPTKDDRGLLRSPDLAEVPGPPAGGPWDDVWTSEASILSPDLSALPPAVREEASKSGFKSVSCYPVHPGVEGRPDACLVVWSRVAGEPRLNVQMAIDRAVGIASLAMSHAANDEGLRDAAYRDALTGLGNRRSFFDALEGQVEVGAQPAVLYIDLDGFKRVNDLLGHLAGDAVLRVAARRLASVMRPTDELARLGGDEFAVLCGGTVSTDQMVLIAERVVEQLNRPLSVGDGQNVDIGASIGIALGLPPGTLADAIIGHADRALYEAKAKGRGRWAFADPNAAPLQPAPDQTPPG